MKSVDENRTDLTGFIDAYRGPLIGLIAAWGASWTDAVEIAQDSFVEAWLKRDYCRGDWTDPEVFGRWLRGVAYNKYRNWSRSLRRLQSRTMTIDAAVPQRSGSMPDRNQEERLEALRRAIDRLPARQKEVVLMHYLEETSVKDVAMLLSVSTKTVEGRLYQARRALHRMLHRDDSFQKVRRLLCL